MPINTCPHCQSDENTFDAKFCISCGKAIESLSTEPQIVDSKNLSSSQVGQTIQKTELEKTIKKSSSALLAVAIIQLVFGLFICAIASFPPAVTIAVLAIAFIFFALWFWSKKSPFPAAVAGLVIFITLHAIEAIADPTAIARGIIMKIIIISLLAKAVKAGVTYKKLTETA